MLLRLENRLVSQILLLLEVQELLEKLFLLRKLLRDMGGRISHERDERAGETHFRINLPIAAG